MTAARYTRPRRSAQRLGPWGTSRATERRYGYPRPWSDRTDELLERIEALEVLVAWRLAAEMAEAEG